ncbi:MAG: RAD55 family ATPase [Promethearchaeota archaeon]
MYIRMEKGTILLRASTGIPAIDELLGGSLIRGKVYLLAADNGTKPTGLIFPFAKHAIKEGEMIVFACNEYPAEEAMEQLQEYSIDVDAAIEAKQLVILDLWTENEKPLDGVIYAGNPGDPHKVMYAYQRAYEEVTKLEKSVPIRVIMDSLSGAVMNFGFERAYRLASRACRLMKLGKAIGMSIVVPKMHEDFVAESFQHLYDGVICLTLHEEPERIMRYIRITKSPIAKFDSRLVPYEVTSSGFKIAKTSEKD